MKTVGKILNWTLALTCVSAMAVEPPASASKVHPSSQPQASVNVDNTSVNERDEAGETMTPQNQSNSAEDRELLAAVRRAIVKDKSLSTMAHNVKVMVAGGVVTLRGPVKNANEKTKIESLAKHVKGITSTDNQLDVKTDISSQ